MSKKRIAEIIDQGVEDNLRQQHEIDGRREAPNYPEKGGEWNGISPGKWSPDRYGMPPDCPVKVLGMDGDILYVIDALGQLVAITDSGFGINRLQRLFGRHQAYLEWAWPRFGKEGISGFDMNWARGCFYTAADERGLWNAVSSVRGLGAWTLDDGRLIFNCGDALFINGMAEPTGEVDGHFYPARPSVDHPWHVPVTHEGNPARALYRILQSWNWERPEAAAFMVLGSIGVMVLSGALPWRPSMFLVGDAATGKSALQDIIALAVGKMLVSTADTTPAGIYQAVQMDARPVAVDELEAEADPRKVAGVIKLARLSASGALMLRGGADHKGTQFQARNSFMFSAINSPVTSAANISRLAVMNLKKLDEKQQDQGVPELLNADELPGKLMRRMIDEWPRFNDLWQDYRAALRGGGHDSRGQDTYGTFLACAHMLLGDEGVDEFGFNIENFAEWGDMLAIWRMPEVASRQENWRACLHHLLTSRVESWRHGTRQTVGKAIDDLLEANSDYSLYYCRQDLQQAGILIEENPQIGEGYFLVIPHSGDMLARLFEGSKWAGSDDFGVWSGALRQGPDDIIITRKGVNRATVNGVQGRCIKVSINALRALEQQEADADEE